MKTAEEYLKMAELAAGRPPRMPHILRGIAIVAINEAIAEATAARAAPKERQFEATSDEVPPPAPHTPTQAVLKAAVMWRAARMTAVADPIAPNFGWLADAEYDLVNAVKAYEVS